MPDTRNPDRPRITRVTDRTGRVLGVRLPDALQRLRMFETVGPDNARNEQYLGFAGLAVSVVEIDGEVCEPIATKRQLEARILQLDDHGLEATGAALAALSQESGAAGAAPRIRPRAVERSPPAEARLPAASCLPGRPLLA